MNHPPDVFGLIRYLAAEKERMLRQNPPGIPAFIEWRDNTYVGSFQEIAPEYSAEIILLNKSLQPVSEEFKSAILTFDKNRPRLRAEPTFDLRASMLLLRRSGDRLMKLTRDQEDFLQKEGVEIIEETTGETITVFASLESTDPRFPHTGTA